MARLTLTARLTLLFAVGASTVLLVLGWLTGIAIDRHFEQQDLDALAGKMQLAQHTIARVSTRSELDALKSQLNDALIGHHDLVVQVLGPNGDVLLASAGVHFPREWLAHAPATPAEALFQWSQGGRSFRGMALAIPTAIPHWQPLVVAVAVDIAHHTEFTRSLMRALWVFVACAALATGVLGWLAASRGLAPLRTMRDKAAAVTAHHLHQRLPVDAVPPELAELATSLNEMLARLEDAFRRLSDFSSDIAHELRTPVSNLMTETQVALSRPRDAASYRATLESNAEEYERLARMISDMLFLAKAEYGQMSDWVAEHGESVHLAQEVRDLFEFYEALAEEKGIHLDLLGTCSVWGDRLMLRRAVSNLLSNALRYTPRAGTVRVCLSELDGICTLTVENPGPTIPAHQLARVFERFFRADPSRQQATGEGTGLGLAITQAIVHAHQGQVSVFSEAGKTRFSIQLAQAPGRTNV
ncbi:MAG: heavy metal sensor histidine kinase [Burkholderiales bacterium]|nr:heavy metal sensor histidine kinase [Burkholderiales bacterium]MBK9345696.1 heavy metal sensor histidine kinase [Burkholderiales bacterium]